MHTKIWLSALAVIVSLSFGDAGKLLTWTLEEVHAADTKDTQQLPGPAPSATCKKNCATQQTACSGRCRGLEPQVTRCQESCAKTFDECVKKCDQLPTSLLDSPEDSAQLCLSLSEE